MDSHKHTTQQDTGFREAVRRYIDAETRTQDRRRQQEGWGPIVVMDRGGRVLVRYSERR